MLKDRLGAAIKTARLSRGEVCRRTGITLATLAHILSGQTPTPRTDTLVALAEVLGTSVDVLLVDERLRFRNYLKLVLQANKERAKR